MGCFLRESTQVPSLFDGWCFIVGVVGILSSVDHSLIAFALCPPLSALTHSHTHTTTIWHGHGCSTLCLSEGKKGGREGGGGKDLASAVHGLPQASRIDLRCAVAHCWVPHTTWRVEAQHARYCVPGIGHQRPASSCQHTKEQKK